jgi:hypothetical protein
VTFVWIRGHAGDPNNHRVDRLAELGRRVDFSSLSHQDRVRLADLLVVGGLMTWTAVDALADLTGQDPLDVLAEIEEAMPGRERRGRRRMSRRGIRFLTPEATTEVAIDELEILRAELAKLARLRGRLTRETARMTDKPAPTAPRASAGPTTRRSGIGVLPRLLPPRPFLVSSSRGPLREPANFQRDSRWAGQDSNLRPWD